MRRLFVFIACLAGAAAQADGALPAATQVFLPAAHAHRIVAATNQGLFISENDGTSWRRVCESTISPATQLEPINGYQLGPDDTLYAWSAHALFFSTDLGCSWKPASLPANRVVTDVFPDPSEPTRVFAILRSAADTSTGVFVSRDRGQSFSDIAYFEPNGLLFGVENSAAAPDLLYVSGLRYSTDGGPYIQYLATTTPDGGAVSSFDHPELGSDLIAILRVDPVAPTRAYLRIGFFGDDALAESFDAGATVVKLAQLGAPMTAFARSGDGGLYVGDSAGRLWAFDVDAGVFKPRSAVLANCFGERAGLLYACASAAADAGYDLGVSADEGKTFQPLLVIAQTPASCANAFCDPSLADAGTPDAGAVDAGVDAGTPATDAGTTPPPAPKGCGCGALEPLGLLAGLFVGRLFVRNRRQLARRGR